MNVECSGLAVAPVGRIGHTVGRTRNEQRKWLQYHPRGTPSQLFKAVEKAPYGNAGKGCSIETLAELIGDTPKVAFDHYGKEWRPTPEPAKRGEWLVARVCSEYIGYCERGLAAFNYAQEMHDVPNPLRGLKKPAHRPRLHSLSTDDEQAVYTAADDCFRDFVFAAIHTGLRPFCELAKLTADDVVETDRGMMWRVYSSKTKKTRKNPVRPEVAELARRLMKSAPQGFGVPLFRNTHGDPWKNVTGVGWFLRLKRKLGWDKHPIRKHYSCYSCRHTFAHRMLAGFWNGGVVCSIETLAELIGDTPKVAFDHYGREWGQHYQKPLWAAVGAAPASPGSRHD